MSVTYLSTDEGKIAVEVRGSSGPLVICSPGMGDTRDAYYPLADILTTQGFRVAMMDARGHGDSTAFFTRFGDEATADDFILAAQTFSSGAPVVLAGASFSAGAAVIAAGKRQDLFSGIILLGPFIRNPPGAAAKIGAAVVMPLMFGGPWGPAAWKAYASTLWPGLGEEAAKERAEASKKMLTRPLRWKAFQFLIKSLDHSVVAPWIPKVKADVVVFMGSKDPDWSDPKKEAEWVAAQFKNVDMHMIEGVGHAPMLERPDEVGEATSRFLHRLKSEGRMGSNSGNRF